MSRELDSSRTRDRHCERGEDRGIPGTPLILLSGIRPMLDGLWLVDKLLGENSFSVLYGQPGSGKSMLALDLAMSIAAGCEWFGRKVSPGAVIYATGEGRIGVVNRLCALRNTRHEASTAGRGQLPLALYADTINLFDGDEDVSDLKSWCEAFERERKEPVTLIIIDTLADSLSGGDENAGKDMGLLLKRVRRIHTETGAHVMLVHHTGKDGGWARGHSSLKAKADTMIKVEKGAARVEKQKDGPLTGPLKFDIRPVLVGHSDMGDKVFSAVIDPVAGEADKQTRIGHLTGKERQVYDVLRSLIETDGVTPSAELGAPAGVKAITGKQCLDACKTADVFTSPNGKPNPDAIKSGFQRAKRRLIEKRLIVSPKGSLYVWLAPDDGNLSEAPD